MLQENQNSDRFGTMFVIGAVAAVVILGGLIAAFVLGAEGINQSPEDLSRNHPERTVDTVSAPPASNVQSGVDTPSVRLVNNGAALEIDFAACHAGQQRFDLPAGVATYSFTGHDGGDCIVDYGDDTTLPGQVTTACRVPASRGTVQFLIHDGRADMSSIADRCSKI